MNNEKELKKQLKELIESNKIVVGVEQNKDDDYNTIKKMILKNIWTDEKINILQLTSFLYQKTILKAYNIKIRYSYNYSDTQTIEIVQTYHNCDDTITKTKYIFYNIPTNLGYLDIYNLESRLNNEK